MFERRQRVTNGLGFSHVQRSLQHGEQIPALPGLSEQILACRHELARNRREATEPVEDGVSVIEMDADYDEDA